MNLCMTKMYYIHAFRRKGKTNFNTCNTYDLSVKNPQGPFYEHVLTLIPA